MRVSVLGLRRLGRRGGCGHGCGEREVRGGEGGCYGTVGWSVGGLGTLAGGV